MIDVGPHVAFAAGLVGFFSPCVLPLLPGYVGYMTGASVGERVPLRKALPGTLAFVGGLTVVFVSLGATASVLSGFLHEHKRGLELFSGAFIIVLGVLMIASERLPFFLLRERRFDVRPRAGVVPTFLLGAAFAFAWTPCLGFTLGAVLNLAASSEGLSSGIRLLFLYSLGIGLPFIAVGLGLVRVGPALKRYAAKIQVIGGAVLICVGVLILTNRLTWITITMQRWLDRVGLDFWNF